MGELYIIAGEDGAGKTAVCAGLAINLLNDGKKVGYLNLQGAEKADDTSLTQQIPGLEIIPNESSPVKGMDIVLAEAKTGKELAEKAKKLKARVILVEAYAGQPKKSASPYKALGESLAGIIVNKVPQCLLENAKEEAAAKYGAEGVKVLGVIPEDRVLLAITVGELAECIGGKILNHAEKSGDLVENYMMGAMVVGSGLDYFGRKKNKAVIIRGERLDMQLAALETPTSCLVLSGSSQPPAYGVLYRAENRGIPVITTGTTINDIIKIIEDKLPNTGLSYEKKLAKMAETVKQNLDIKIFG
ncbi:MAG: phosphotransacetylase family protein [Dehalococcoidales bacterium]|nr:phosphotransacetylase family protein [Dehalococcoidales bacterium]